jgi:hypothetical protein
MMPGAELWREDMEANAIVLTAESAKTLDEKVQVILDKIDLNATVKTRGGLLVELLKAKEKVATS